LGCSDSFTDFAESVQSFAVHSVDFVRAAAA
jgi:hypothetical protein